MKISVILILIVSVSTCNEQNTNDKIERFKNYIGSDNFQATDQFLSNMETKLGETYQTGNLSSDIKKYLEKTVEGNTGIQFNEEDCEALKIYELSGMESKSTRGEYDTVYFRGESLICEYGEGRGEEIIVMNGKSKEEIIEETKCKGYRKLIHWGKLTGGLKLIAEHDTLISQYVEFRMKVGDANPKKPAEYILNSNVDFSENYFHRLIILVELYFREIKEYGC